MVPINLLLTEQDGQDKEKLVLTSTYSSRMAIPDLEE
jgi:hypothetical protein